MSREWWSRIQLDCVIGFLIAASAATVTALTHQGWLVGDGVQLVEAFDPPLGKPGLWSHALYLPLGRAVGWLTGLSPYDSLALLGPISAAVMGPCLYWAARSLSASRWGALLASTVLVLSPAIWFHSTIVEVHAVHAAHLAAGLALICFPGYRNSRSIRLVAAVVMGSLILSHRSALLLLPPLALLAAARQTRIEVGGKVRALVVTSVWLGGGMAIGVASDELLHSRFGGQDWLGTGALITRELTSSSWAFLKSEIVAPFGLVLIPAAYGIWLNRQLPLRCAALIAGCVVHPIGVLIFGVPTLGGYLVPSLVFAALAASSGLSALSKSWRIPVVMLVVVHGWMGWRAIHSPDQARASLHAHERLELASALLPEGGVMLTSDAAMQVVTGRLNGVWEVNIAMELGAALASGEAPSDFQARVLPELEALVEGAQGRVVWVRDWPGYLDVVPDLGDYVEPIERRLLSRFEWEEVRVMGSIAFVRK